MIRALEWLIVVMVLISVVCMVYGLVSEIMEPRAYIVSHVYEDGCLDVLDGNGEASFYCVSDFK